MNRADQGKPTQDLDKGRGWLERAEAVLDAGEDSSAVEFARAAALISGGYVQLAALGRWATWRVEDMARITAEREADRENDEVVRESNRLGLEQQRAELAEIERRSARMAELDAAARRSVQAAEEARPHDKPAPKGGLADQLIAIANAVYGNDTGNVLDAPTGHGLAAVVRTLADGPLIQTEWAAAQFRKLAVELETAGEADRG